MKDALDSAAAPSAENATAERRLRSRDDGHAPGVVGNRKLIRPGLAAGAERRESGEVPRAGSKKPAPPEQTFAENFYYQKQMQTRTPMVVVLNDGEQLEGIIEWYDRDCIKLNRTEQMPNLLIYKSSIKYLFKQPESNGGK